MEMEFIEKAKLKTMSDFCLVLQHTKAMQKSEAAKHTLQAENDPLFLALLHRNILLFQENAIVMF
jgi:hypothetical protein